MPNFNLFRGVSPLKKRLNLRSQMEYNGEWLMTRDELVLLFQWLFIDNGDDHVLGTGWYSRSKIASLHSVVGFFVRGFSIIVYQQARNLGYFLLSGECQKGKRKRNKNIILVTIEKKKKKKLNHDKRNVTFLAIW